MLCCVKNLEMIQTGFSVFRGVPSTTPDKLKLCLAKFVMNFFHRSWNFFLNILRFFYKKFCWYYSILFFCYCKAFWNNVNEWLLLDVNPKTRFSGVTKFPKAQKLNKNKYLSKKNSELTSFKTIKLIYAEKDFVVKGIPKLKTNF